MGLEKTLGTEGKRDVKGSSYTPLEGLSSIGIKYDRDSKKPEVNIRADGGWICAYYIFVPIFDC
ncbi:hypothetical protein J4446_03170 [Candidatus Woesearchaeota archaeon]|nr:hypothetical protein [Candidatus Woesearchaeota archaeon]